MSLRSDINKAVDGVSLSTNELLKFAALGMTSFADSSLNADLLNALNGGRSGLSDNLLAQYLAKAAASLETSSTNIIEDLSANVPILTTGGNTFTITKVGRLAVITVDFACDLTSAPANISITAPGLLADGGDYASPMIYQVDPSGVSLPGWMFLSTDTLTIWSNTFGAFASDAATVITGQMTIRLA